MTVSATSGSNGLAGLPGGLRKFLKDSFVTAGNIRAAEDGRYNVFDKKLNFIPKVGTAVKQNNHVTVDKKVGNKYFAKVKATTTFSPARANSVGLIAKKQDENNYLAIEVNSSNEVRFMKYENGNRSILKSVKMEKSTGKEFTMSLDVNVNRFTFYINDRKVFSETDGSFKNGEFGFGAFEGPASFSDLEIYKA